MGLVPRQDGDVLVWNAADETYYHSPLGVVQPPPAPSNYPILFKFDEVSGTQAEDFYNPGSYMNFTAEPTWGQTPLAPGSTSAMFNNSGYGEFSAPAVGELQEYVFDVWLQKTNNGCDTDNRLLTVGVVSVLTNCGQVYARINGEAWTIPVDVGFPGPAVRVQGSYSVLTGYWTFQVGENFQDGFVSATGAVDSLLVEVGSADNGTTFDELYVDVNTPT